MNREVLIREKFVVNRAVRDGIEKFLNQHPEVRHSAEIYLPSKLCIELRTAIAKHDRGQVVNLVQQDKRLLARYLAPGRLAYHVACEIGSWEILTYICDQLGDEKIAVVQSQPRPDAWQPVVLNDRLKQAIIGGDVAETRKLLSMGADIETRDVTWKTPLCIAAKNGHLDIVNLLLERGANISARDNEHNAALDLAVLQSHTSIVTCLLDYGLPDYQPHSAADQKHFSYMALKMAHNFMRDRGVSNDRSYSAERTAQTSSSVSSASGLVDSNYAFFGCNVPKEAASNVELAPEVEPIGIKPYNITPK